MQSNHRKGAATLLHISTASTARALLFTTKNTEKRKDNNHQNNIQTVQIRTMDKINTIPIFGIQEELISSKKEKKMKKRKEKIK